MRVLRALEAKVEAAERAPSATLTLAFEQRQKSRLSARLDSGEEVAVLVPRGRVLRGGDRLVADDGSVVEVRAAVECVSTVRCEDSRGLARAAYHLGNRHVAVEVGAGCVRYLHDHVLDEMVRGLGLTVAVVEAGFEPEGGAYGGHSHGHGHAHGAAAAAGHGATLEGAGSEPVNDRHSVARDHRHDGHSAAHDHSHDDHSDAHRHRHDPHSAAHHHRHDGQSAAHDHNHDDHSDAHDRDRKDDSAAHDRSHNHGGRPGVQRGHEPAHEPAHGNAASVDPRVQEQAHADPAIVRDPHRSATALPRSGREPA